VACQIKDRLKDLLALGVLYCDCIAYHIFTLSNKTDATGKNLFLYYYGRTLRIAEVCQFQVTAAGKFFAFPFSEICNAIDVPDALIKPLIQPDLNLQFNIQLYSIFQAE
jgi:hypothetical protein